MSSLVLLIRTYLFLLMWLWPAHSLRKRWKFTMHFPCLVIIIELFLRVKVILPIPQQMVHTIQHRIPITAKQIQFTFLLNRFQYRERRCVGGRKLSFGSGSYDLSSLSYDRLLFAAETIFPWLVI